MADIMTMRIAVFAALPQEISPILRLNPGWRPVADEPFSIHAHRAPEREILLIRTGVGTEPAGRAARYIAERAGSTLPIDLMVSVGFAGALSSDFVLGQVVWAGEVAVFDDSSGTCAVRYLCSDAAGGPAGSPGFFAGLAVTPVLFLTVDRLREKAELARLVLATLAVVEMETASIAGAAHAHAVPFMGLRAISDELSLEIDLDLDSIVNDQGKMRLPPIMLAFLARPRLVRSLPALYHGCRLAGNNLALVVEHLLVAPEEELRALAGPPRLVEEPPRRDPKAER
jgi:adenosylhomocysteine nucleosidase